MSRAHLNIILIVSFEVSALAGTDIYEWLKRPEVMIHLIDDAGQEAIRMDRMVRLQLYPKSLRHANELAEQLNEDFGLTLEIATNN